MVGVCGAAVKKPMQLKVTYAPKTTKLKRKKSLEQKYIESFPFE